MKLTVISSGSRANAALIENNGAAVLVDCGVSMRMMKAGLLGEGLTVDDIRAVFVTHSHSDHIKGLSMLRDRTDAPFYSPSGVPLCESFDGTLEIDGFSVSAFDCSHDVPCVGYKIACGERAVCIATDSGVVTDGMRKALTGCRTVMLESNHDIDMLKSGSYPPQLKMRILSDKGHLSNADSARFLTELAHSGMRRAILAHLSENNNTPLLARAAAVTALSRYGLDRTVTVDVATPGLTVEIE